MFLILPEGDREEIIAAATINSTIAKSYPSIIPPKKFVKLDVEKISGTLSGTNTPTINIGLRTVNNNINGLIHLNNETSQYTTDWITLNENVNIPYVYIGKTTTCSEIKLKITLSKKDTNYDNSKIVNENLKMSNGKTELGEFQCSINAIGNIILNGKVTANTFIKLSNGVELQQSNITDDNNIIIPANKKVTLSIEEISGNIVNSDNTNLVLKYADNTFGAICSLLDPSTTKTTTINSTTDDISVAYLFLAADSEFANYVIKPNLTIE